MPPMTRLYRLSKLTTITLHVATSRQTRILLMLGVRAQPLLLESRNRAFKVDDDKKYAPVSILRPASGTSDLVKESTFERAAICHSQPQVSPLSIQNQASARPCLLGCFENMNNAMDVCVRVLKVYIGNVMSMHHHDLTSKHED
jgi:hypothetical protein